MLIGIIVGSVIFVALIALLVVLRSPGHRGKSGESRTSVILQKYVDEVGGYLIDDVILPYGNRTSQIDHILFVPAGVIVIETKNWGGWIFGRDYDEYWTQTIGINRIHKHRHHNPVKQNHVHVKVVRIHTKEYERGKFYNLIVFTQDNTEHIKSDYVVGRKVNINLFIRKWCNGLWQYSFKKNINF